MLIEYARVLTTGKNSTMRTIGLVIVAGEKLSTDKASGVEVDRPELA